MARNHTHYYSWNAPSHRSAPRWPWLAGLALLVAVVGLGAALIGADVVDVRALQRAWTGAPNPAAPTPAPAAAAQVDAAPPAAESVAEPAAAVGGGVPLAAPLAAAQPTEEPAPNVTLATVAPATETAPPTTAPAPAAPGDVVALYAERWNAGDYDGLYDMLTEEARDATPRQEFVDRYEAIAERAGLTSVTATMAGEPNLQNEVPIRVEYESAIVGKFAEVNRVPLVLEANAWKVAWTPSLIFERLGADGCVDVDSAPARRGRILDRDGGVLAEDGQLVRVGVVPGEIEDEGRLLRELGSLTGLQADQIKERYEGQEPSWFVPIKDFPAAREQELINALDEIGGAGIRRGEGRVYPLGSKAAHLVGYVSSVTAEQLEADPSLAPGQIIGQAGIEAGADELLTGEPGGRLIVVQCETRGERAVIAERPAVPARDIVLTIDRELQQATDAALAAQGSIRGSAVVLDPRSGAVLAMASVPSFDPNGFVLGFSEDEQEALTSESRKPLLNRAAQAAYPTGSIFKAITFSAAMEHLGYTAETAVDCPSTFQIDGSDNVWEDWTVASGLPAQGPLTLHQALVNSCNTVFYQLGRDLDQKDDALLPDMAKAFGLGAPTDIPYLPEVGGSVPDPKWKLDTFGDYWATGDAVNLAIGQGFLTATPLQMATAYAAIANGGDLLQPYVVERAVAPDGAEEQLGERIVRDELPLSRATMTTLQAALRAQTSDPNGFGSVRVFGDFQWPIAGKTGTAQTEANRGQKPHSWFAAFGPYGEEATIASIAMVESVGEGVQFAAPATRQIYEAYLGSDLARRR